MASPTPIYRPCENMSGSCTLQLESIPECGPLTEYPDSVIHRVVTFIPPEDTAAGVLGSRRRPGGFGLNDSLCVEDDCPQPTAADVQRVWERHAKKFDGVCKVPGQEGKPNAYSFYLGEVNKTFGNDSLCKMLDGNFAFTLAARLKGAEALTIDLWTAASTHHGFGACNDRGPEGKDYRVSFPGDDEYDQFLDDLDSLANALRWQRGNPGKLNNPYNPQGLPLEISLEKVEAIRRPLWNSYALWGKDHFWIVVVGIIGSSTIAGYFSGGHRGALRYLTSWDPHKNNSNHNNHNSFSHATIGAQMLTRMDPLAAALRASGMAAQMAATYSLAHYFGLSAEATARMMLANFNRPSDPQPTKRNRPNNQKRDPDITSPVGFWETLGLAALIAASHLRNRALMAGGMAAADGPLPLGEAVAVGVMFFAIIEIPGEIEEGL